MTPELPSQSELDVAEALRRRRQQLHDELDTQFESLAIELGVQLQATPRHTCGISFEPAVQLEYVPSVATEILPGFYALRAAAREVEVLPCVEFGRVHFELVDNCGQVHVHVVDEPLFHLLFRKMVRPRLSLASGALKATRYGIDSSNPRVALRHNPDGTTDRGFYDQNGHFVADE